MGEVGITELLEAGVHFGHQTRRWNPKMRRFIYGERGGVYIIDLLKTAALLAQAQQFASELAHRGGTVVRITDIVPDKERAYSPDELRRRNCKTTPERSARHPGFHATDTVDYAVCLEGEVWAVLDEDETLMRPGDVLIQRGTYHAWSNRSDRICRMLFVLIDAEPLRNH